MKDKVKEIEIMPETIEAGLHIFYGYWGADPHCGGPEDEQMIKEIFIAMSKTHDD